MSMPARWLSLTRTKSDRLPRWFTPPRPAPPPSPARAGRAASCGCPRSARAGRRRRRRSAGSAVATPERWHEEVERGALAGEDRRAAARDTSPTLGAGGDRVAVVDAASRRCTVGSSCANTSVAQRGAGEHAVGAGHDVGRRRARRPGGAPTVRSPSGPRSSASARRDGVARTTSTGGSNVAHGVGSGSPQRAARSRASASPANTKRPRNSRRRLGVVGAGVRAARSRRSRRGRARARAHGRGGSRLLGVGWRAIDGERAPRRGSRLVGARAARRRRAS